MTDAGPPDPPLRVPRSIETVVVIGLLIITTIAVSALAARALLFADDAAVTTLGLLATGGLAALGALLGVRANRN